MSICPDDNSLGEVELYAGQMDALPVKLLNADGTPLELNGHYLKLVVKESFASPTVEFEWTSDILSSAEGLGQVPIDLTGASPELFAHGAEYVGTLWLTDEVDSFRQPRGNLVVKILPAVPMTSMIPPPPGP